LIEEERQRRKQREQRLEVNTQNNDHKSTKVKESYSIAILYAYHLHISGDHEKSFPYNNLLAEYACKIGDLDVAERCYKRDIADAKYLGRLQNEMACLLQMTVNVCII
jgi:hypothetical protein